MRFAAFLVLLGLACDAPCDRPSALAMTGDAPPLSDVVIVVASEHAARLCPFAVPFRGRVEWVRSDVQCGSVRAAGCDVGWGDPCAVVHVVVEWRPFATDSGLAHELGHHVDDVCGLGWGEAGASAFAEDVNREAWMRAGAITSPPPE